MRNRQLKLFLYASAALLFGLLITNRAPFATADAPRAAANPDTALQTAWQTAQDSGSWQATADVEMHVIPNVLAPDDAEETRIDWRIESSTLLPDRARLTMRAEGQAFSSRVLELIQAGDDTFIKEVDGYEPISNPAGIVMPTVDTLAFLKSARDGRLLESNPAWQRYGFTVDGAAYAAQLAGGSAPLAASYDGMTGTGELWVSADGLPLRQVVTLVLPNASAEYSARVRYMADLSGYGTVEPFATPVEMPNGTYQLPDAPAGNSSINVAPSLSLRLFDIAPATVTVPLVAVLLALGLTALLLRRQRTTRLYRMVALALIFNMAAGPLLHMLSGRQTVQFAEAANAIRQEQTSATLDRALGVDALQQQATAQQALADARAVTATGTAAGDITVCADPHAREENDSDFDGLSDLLESCIGTDPFSADTDEDGLSDRVELEGFDYAGKHWTSDPFVADSNGDGRSDLIEWYGPTGLPTAEEANPSGLAQSFDNDGDGIPDLWDDDDDNDGVRDGTDLSPEHQRTDQDGFGITIATGNQTAVVYVDVQVRTTNPDHLRYSLGVLDWPYDELGEVRDLNGSRDDVRLVPMLEIETDSKPGSEIAQNYGIVPAGRLLRCCPRFWFRASSPSRLA